MDIDRPLDEIASDMQTLSKSDGRRRTRSSSGRGRGRGRGQGSAGAGSTGGRGRSTPTMRTGTRRGRGESSTRGTRGTPRAGKASTRNGRSTAPTNHLAGASIDDIANASKGNRILKAGKETDVRKLAGSIKYVLSVAGEPPSILAGGPQAVNQAVKAIAFARRAITEGEVLDGPADILMQPTFDGNLRVSMELNKTNPLKNEMETDNLIVKDGSDPYKVAGAIAAKVREGERTGILTKGPQGVFKSVQAIAAARRYVDEEGFDIKCAPFFVDVEWDGRDSVGIHFAILARHRR